MSKSANLGISKQCRCTVYAVMDSVFSMLTSVQAMLVLVDLLSYRVLTFISQSWPTCRFCYAYDGFVC